MLDHCVEEPAYVNRRNDFHHMADDICAVGKLELWTGGIESVMQSSEAMFLGTCRVKAIGVWDVSTLKRF